MFFWIRILFVFTNCLIVARSTCGLAQFGSNPCVVRDSGSIVGNGEVVRKDRSMSICRKLLVVIEF